MNQNILLFHISTFFRSFLVFNVVLPSFFVARGIDISFSFIFLACMNICVVLLEYPTGVLGDVFGHKISMSLGYIVVALSLLLMPFVSGFPSYLLLGFLYCIGYTLFSGSDAALLKTISHNVSKDLSIYKVIVLSSIGLAGLIGQFLFSIDISLPFMVEGLMLVVAAIVNIFIADRLSKERKEKPHIGDVISKSIGEIKHNSQVQQFLISLGLLGGFLSTLKYITTIYYILFFFDREFSGIIYSSVLFVDVIGIYLFAKSKTSARITVIASILLWIGTIIFSGFSYIHIPLLIISILPFSILNIWLQKTFLDISKESVRASLLSASSVITRAVNVVILFIIGYVSNGIIPLWIFYLIAVGSILLSISYLLYKNPDIDTKRSTK